jgi:hypothetical protein
LVELQKCEPCIGRGWKLSIQRRTSKVNGKIYTIGIRYAKKVASDENACELLFVRESVL